MIFITYQKLVGKLNYHAVTRPDISLAVSRKSQFHNSQCECHQDATINLLQSLESTWEMKAYHSKIRSIWGLVVKQMLILQALY